MTRAQFSKHKTENSQEKFKNLTQADKRIVVGKLNNKVFVNIAKPEYLAKQEKAGFDSNKLFNFQEISQEILSALKSAKIIKRHLKNKQVALQAYDIIQKTLAKHTHEIMNKLNDNRISISDSSFTSKNNHNNQNPNEKEEEEKDKSSDVNKSQETNMKPCGVDTSNEKETGKKIPPPPDGKFGKLPPPPPPPHNFGKENRNLTFLEDLQNTLANLKKVDKETIERRKQEKKKIDFRKKEPSDLSEEFILKLKIRKKEFHNSEYQDEDDEDDEDDDDSEWD